MTRRDDQNLDRAIEEIRNEPIDAEDLRAAADRVRQRLEAVSPALVEGCAGYQALFPAYLRGEVSPSRTLLLEDHVRECVACRKALREARAPRPVSVRELPVGVDRRGTARILSPRRTVSPTATGRSAPPSTRYRVPSSDWIVPVAASAGGTSRSRSA